SSWGGRCVADVTRDVAVQVVNHAAFGPVPAAVRPGQPVLVAAGEDRLQREVREGLEDGDVGGGGGGAGVLVDVDDDVGRDVLGARQAVVELDVVGDPLPGGGRARFGLVPLAVLEQR